LIPQSATHMVRVWDPVVRLFHWSVVAGCFANMFVLEEGETAHDVVGYVVAGVLVVRVLWGFVGSRHARFADFVPMPGSALRYAGATLRGEEERSLGHNPLGALMILALMTLLAGVSITGWMLTTDAWWGNHMLEEVHGTFSNLILVFAIVHVGGVIYASRHHHENLVRAMITGRKRAR